MDKIDTAIGDAIKNGKDSIPHANSDYFIPTVNIECKPSKYLKSGMAVRRRQLEQNFKIFASRTTADLDPTLFHLQLVARNAVDLLYEAKNAIKIIHSGVNQFHLFLLKIKFGKACSMRTHATFDTS